MDYFYHGITRKYVVAFAHLFSDIHVQRLNENGELVSDIRVPIVYAGKGKMFQEIRSLDTSKANVAQVLPRMGFIISSMTYDAMRKQNNTITYRKEGGEMKFLGVPYNFTFDLSIMTKNQDDMLQILEQVCVMFTPDLSISIKEIPELELTRDVSICLDSVMSGSIHEFGELEDRTIAYDLSFTVKGHLYPPVSEPGSVIHTIFTNYKSMKGSAPNPEEVAKPYDIQSEWKYDEVTEEITKTLREDYYNPVGEEPEEPPVDPEPEPEPEPEPVTGWVDRTNADWWQGNSGSYFANDQWWPAGGSLNLTPVTTGPNVGWAAGYRPTMVRITLTTGDPTNIMIMPTNFNNVLMFGYQSGTDFALNLTADMFILSVDANVGITKIEFYEEPAPV